LHALCDLLSWSTLDGEHCQEALIAAQALVRNAERPDLKIRLEYLALKHDLQRESGNEENRIRPLVEALLTQPGFSSLPRSLKIEILMFNSDLQMRGGDRHAAIECLNLAQSEARLLQDKTVIASCEAQLSAMTPSGSEFQFAFCERQAAAGALISAINDVNVLHLLSRQLSDERCTVSLRSETARQLGARLITLKTQANLSADEVTRRLSSRDSYYLTKQSEQLFAERTRADSESHWSLMVTRIGLVVFCGLAFVLFRDRWHLRQANRRLQSEIARNEQQHLEKERMELRLAKTERLESLGALAGGIAHDFSNLLVGVIGNADLLKHLEPASPMANQCLDGIIRSAETAADLSRKMLAYAGKEVAKKRVIDLNGLIARMLPLLQAGVGGRHAIKFSPASECLPTEADSGQLEQILLNLVTNASQAIGGNHGKITIKSGVVTLENIPVEVPTFGNRKSGGTFVWFEVSDTGPGIPESHLGRVFEPFFTTKQQSAGHGFGLAVVYGHVNRHDGLIQLQTSPGNGTSLRILLPYSSELVSNDATPIMDSLVTTVSEGFTVVAVDDQVEVLDVIQRTLAACRVKIIGFLTATEALEFLSENNSIDCILLDMVMPVVDGTAMLEALSQRGNVVPVVIMSGYSSRNLEDFPGLPGVSAVLQKPFRPGDLVKAICSAIPPERRTIRLDVSQLQKSHP
jgi:signal transduction histidine kinase/AmiR/NasT family two-component response regulator